jgi:DNA adenine methylase
MFFGSGAMTATMAGRAKYIFANDNDDDIFNLFMVIKDRKEDLVDTMLKMPVHNSLFQHWRTHQEQEPVWKAVRFLMLSNFGYMGMPRVLMVQTGDDKKHTLKQIEAFFGIISQHTITFLCCDFREVLKKISWRSETDKKNAFIYADPPYLSTGNNYQDSFSEDDTRDLFDILVGSGIRFAVSEFRHPFVMDLAENHGLYVTSLGERLNMKNRREELLIKNYEPTKQQEDLF